MSVDCRFDFDMLFKLKPRVLRTPFPDLVNAMRAALLNVPGEIVEKGRRNAELSRPYLQDRRGKPLHILHRLARSLGVAGKDPQDTQDLRKSWLSERDARIAALRLGSTSVQGRFSDMLLMPDGTLIPSETLEETKNMNLSMEGWQGEVRNDSPFSEDDFDYLFGGNDSPTSPLAPQSTDETQLKAAGPNARQIFLDWPPRDEHLTDDADEDVVDISKRIQTESKS
jgi:hypothetical protein